MRGAYAEAKMLPMMATPSVPPTSRPVSLMAEPTPAISRGSEPMTDSDAGLVTSERPLAITIMLTMIGPKYAVSTSNVLAQSCATPMNTSPTGMTRRGPKRKASRAAIGAVMPAPTANGTVRRPDSSGS